ncbi:MAG: hypothetical protein ABFD03_11375, partial [Clostridiaceae bacterium]
GDNVLTVENSSSVPLLTFYFCAQSGAEMRIRYGQRQIVIEDVKLPETTDTEQATAEKTPEAMTARELIELMRENAASDQFVRLGYLLTQKLEENFFTRPEDIKEALLAFGDSGMAERFEMIRQTMKPSDLGLLMPDLLGNYMKRHS